MSAGLLHPDMINSPAIEAIDWRQHPGESIAQVRDILGALSVEEWREQVALRRFEVSSGHATVLEAGSAERPLILKHLLALGAVDDQVYKIWANEYRPAAWQGSPSGRHVERYHNHRMSIASIIPDGGYTADEHVYGTGMLPFTAMTSPDDAWGAEAQKLEAQTQDYRTGDTMGLYVDEIHRLRGVLRNTVTLIAEMPQERRFGVVFDDEHVKPVTVFYDMGGNYDALSQRFLANS